MSKSTNGKVPDHIKSQFDEKLHGDLRAIWQMTEQAGPPHHPVSPREMDNALADLNSHLEMRENAVPSADKGRSLRLVNRTRLLVAAVALIAATTFFLVVPKTAMVPYGEMAMLELPDGTSVELNSGSVLRYSRFYRFTNRTVQLNGEAYFSVTQHGKPFIVETNGAITEVTGTEFNVRSWSDDPEQKTTVTVTGGEVLFYPELNKTEVITLPAGTSSSWQRQQVRPENAQPVELDDITAWREHRFVFREQSVVSIIRELERRFDTRIELEADGMERSTLTAYYQQQVKLESILEDICTVKGLRYTRTTTGYRIFK